MKKLAMVNKDKLLEAGLEHPTSAELQVLYLVFLCKDVCG